MQTFDQSLFHLFQSGLISQEEALHNATNPDEFKMRASGIVSAGHAMNTMRPASSSATAAQRSEEQETVFVKH
jgi:twitching motility protein PilT